ncbi:hypothetical protein FOA43_004566 [Brettanomyces nanus]|uniref:Uncharacterized protein n=1 Tax=Eeniella nana TaxID=13502 RepID=A0A875S6E0_EENNA|nr:uncharacterized protein FOA43_004566 [Brettanomyces nanus]QPG77161.1 hypothetical protein FOA43_004566 [Brettanomyces nanus]
MLSPDLSSYMDSVLRESIDQIQLDRDYISANQKTQWKDIVKKMALYIRSIVSELYKADMNFVVTNPLDQSRETIDVMVGRVQANLCSRFPQSPPFTIHHLVNTLKFSTPGDLLPPNLSLEDLVDLSKGLTSYKVRSINLITKEDSFGHAENVFHSVPRSLNGNTSTRLANVYAVRFLRVIDRIVSVQSNVDEVNSDLKKCRSQANCSDDKPSSDVTDSIRMTQISWIAEDVNSPKRPNAEPADTDRVIKRSKSITKLKHKSTSDDKAESLESLGDKGGV